MQEHADKCALELAPLRAQAADHAAIIDTKDCRIDELRRALAEATEQADTESRELREQLRAEVLVARQSTDRAQVMVEDTHRYQLAAHAAVERCEPPPRVHMRLSFGVSRVSLLFPTFPHPFSPFSPLFFTFGYDQRFFTPPCSLQTDVWFQIVKLCPVCAPPILPTRGCATIA